MVMFNEETFYEDEDFEIKVSYHEDMEYVHPFVHVTYYTNFNKSILKKSRLKFKELCSKLYNEKYTTLFSYTENVKYASLIDKTYKVLEKYDNMRLIAWDLQ